MSGGGGRSLGLQLRVRAGRKKLEVHHPSFPLACPSAVPRRCASAACRGGQVRRRCSGISFGAPPGHSGRWGGSGAGRWPPSCSSGQQLASPPFAPPITRAAAVCPIANRGTANIAADICYWRRAHPSTKIPYMHNLQRPGHILRKPIDTFCNIARSHCQRWCTRGWTGFCQTTQPEGLLLLRRMTIATKEYWW